MDKIATILCDIKDGKIKENDGLAKLEDDFNQRERDSYRKQQNIKRVLSLYNVEEYMKDIRNPEEILIEKERINRIVYFIKQILMLLSPRYRQVLWMHAIEGKSYQQIGEELGISKQAAHSYIKRIPFKVTSKMLNNDASYSMQYVREILEQSHQHAYHGAIRQHGYLMDRIKQSNGCIRTYLDESFGEHVECNICVNCKERKKNRQ